MTILTALKNAYVNVVDWVDENPRKALWLAVASNAANWWWL